MDALVIPIFAWIMEHDWAKYVVFFFMILKAATTILPSTWQGQAWYNIPMKAINMFLLNVGKNKNEDDKPLSLVNTKLSIIWLLPLMFLMVGCIGGTTNYVDGYKFEQAYKIGLFTPTIQSSRISLCAIEETEDELGVIYRVTKEPCQPLNNTWHYDTSGPIAPALISGGATVGGAALIRDGLKDGSSSSNSVSTIINNSCKGNCKGKGK